MAVIKIVAAAVTAADVGDSQLPLEDAACAFFSAKLSNAQTEWLRGALKVQYSRKITRSSLLAIAAARKCLAKQDVDASRLGVITTGGPLHLWNSWDLTATILAGEADLLDPLRFPHSIVSSIPCTVAAALQAKCFAIAIGHNASAFCDAIVNAVRLLNANCADSIVVVAVNDADAVIDNVVQHGGGGCSCSGAVSYLLTTKNVSTQHLDLIGITSKCDNTYNHIEFRFKHDDWLGTEPFLAAQCGFEFYEALSNIEGNGLSAQAFQVCWSFVEGDMYFRCMSVGAENAA